MPSLTYCWRVKKEVPMLDDEEWQILLPFLAESLEEIKRHRQTYGSTIEEARAAGFGRAALDCYFNLTGYRETNPDRLWRYKRSDYGPPCDHCGKPLRKPKAKRCVECGAVVESKTLALGIWLSRRSQPLWCCAVRRLNMEVQQISKRMKNHYWNVAAMPHPRRVAISLGLVGCLFFGFAFVMSIAAPGFVEQIAKHIIRYEVEKRAHEKVDTIDSTFLAKKAEAFTKGYADEIAQTKQLVVQQLPARLSEVIGEMQNLDCECRKKIETNIRDGFEWRITNASAAQELLTTLIRTKYMETASQLTREFRIFTGTNALVFALLLAAVFFKRRASMHLLPSAVVLLAAASITAYLYLFNQDWLRTLVFSEYVGFAYVGYLCGAFALLCDVIFNRARVTAEALNFILNAIGSAIQVGPC